MGLSGATKEVTAAVPSSSAVTPSSVQAGQVVTLTIDGANLVGATAVALSSPGGYEPGAGASAQRHAPARHPARARNRGRVRSAGDLAGRDGRVQQHHIEDNIAGAQLRQGGLSHLRTTLRLLPPFDRWSGRASGTGRIVSPLDLRALTPLRYAHVKPYGTFKLDMDCRLAIEQAEARNQG